MSVRTIHGAAGEAAGRVQEPEEEAGIRGQPCTVAS